MGLRTILPGSLYGSGHIGIRPDVVCLRCFRRIDSNQIHVKIALEHKTTRRTKRICHQGRLTVLIFPEFYRFYSVKCFASFKLFALHNHNVSCLSFIVSS